jgi:hypothetical protein
MSHPKFEDCLPIIDIEIAKRRNKWTLTSLASIDYSDISQIIRIHIWKKWSQYDSKKPLQPWVSTIITNQLRNLIRNYYGNYARPCLKCDAAIDTDGCKIYGKQCESCPLFAHWKKYKEPATFVKLPVSMENHTNEVFEIADSVSYLTEDIEKLHSTMKRILKPIEWKVYKGLYIDHKDENQIAKHLGLITNEKGRTPGYRYLINLKKQIIKKAQIYIKAHGLH